MNNKTLPYSLAFIACLSALSAPLFGEARHHCKNAVTEKFSQFKKLKYKSCENTKDAQLKVVRTEYRVTGNDAKEAESFIRKHFSMNNVRFICCGWSTAGQPVQAYQDEKGFTYEIRMVSTETLEKDWSKIPYFTVSVIKFLEQP